MMPPRTADRAFEWLINDWCKKDKNLNIIWYGGEPLLNKPLIKKVVTEWSNSPLNLKWSITTNGTMLDDDFMSFMDSHKVGMLLSLDGPPWIHDKQRFYYKGKPSWDVIDPESLLKWRPGLEIAWQLDPDVPFSTDDLHWMIDRGFKKLNFNINWLKEWKPESRIMLQDFMKRVMRLCIRKSMSSNWAGKFYETYIRSSKPLQPCGTGLSMLALTPEGYLYPSQEMAFKAFEPGVAEGTAEYYKVGDVFHDPVINQTRLTEVSGIKNSQMRTPKGFDCGDCAANPVSFGGCHCRYIGQDGHDPKNRYDIAPGWCQSMQSIFAGLHLGAKIEGKLSYKA
jgi:radical SAM protein with 4Fe4S-binding SPASM domain